MRLSPQNSYQGLSRAAARWIAERIESHSTSRICFATGSSPTGTYGDLARLASEGLAVDRIRAVKLDEWGGLALDDPATCESYLRKHVLEPLEISDDRYLSFDSQPVDPHEECARVQRDLDQDPIDICILGLGLNGHLALIEPAETLIEDCHVAKLSESSLRHPMLRESAQAPLYGLTLGTRSILASGEILLLVSGDSKKDVFAKFLDGDVRSTFPASILHEHSDVTCFCDAKAFPLA